MTDADLMTIFKQRIGEPYPSADRQLFLDQSVSAARAMITREGITLNTVTSSEDAELVLMYAEYLVKKRNTTEGMPRMLRFAMNNRLFSEKINGTEACSNES